MHRNVTDPPRTPPFFEERESFGRRRLGAPFCLLMGATGERTVTDVTKPGDLLFLEEVAVVARAKLETVRFWIKQGKLRSIRPGRRRLVRREDLEAFLAGSENTRRGA